MKKANEKSTIIVCTYNMGETISETIISVSKLVSKKHQFLIVDDASEDDTKEIVKNLEYKVRNKIEYVCLGKDPTRQLGETRNQGVVLANTNRIVVQVDADDIYDYGFLEMELIYNAIASEIGSDIFLKGPNINITTRDLMMSVGGYNNFSRGEDRDLWRRLNKLGHLYWVEAQKTSSRSNKSAKRGKIKLLSQLNKLAEADIQSGVNPFSGIKTLMKNRGVITTIFYLIFSCYFILKQNKIGKLKFDHHSHYPPKQRVIKLFDKGDETKNLKEFTDVLINGKMIKIRN